MYLFGYLEFVLLLFLPGVAFLEATHLGRTLSLAERLGLALGLGMAIDVLVLLLWAYGQVGWNYADVGEAVIIASAGATVALVARRRSFALYLKPTRADVFVGIVVVVQALLVLAHYVKYPIFPEFDSIDFSQHVMIVSTLTRGPPSPSVAVLYYGVHLLMVELLSVTGGSAFLATQRTMEILVVLSPLLVYAAASAVWETKPVPLVATLIYVIGGFVWFGSVFNAGLYPNFYGILSALFVVVAISTIIKEPGNRAGWFVCLVSFANAMFSHYTTLLIFPAVVVLAITQLVSKKKLDRSLMAIALIPAVLSGTVFGLFPNLLSTLESFLLSQSGTNVGPRTQLSQLLAAFPFGSFLAAEITSDLATVFLLGMALVGAYVVLRRWSSPSLIPLAWFLTAAVVSPAGANAWRFSYAALLPLCFLAAFGFEPLLARRRAAKEKVRRRRYSRRFTEGSVFTLAATASLILLMVWGSWGTLVVADALDQGVPNGEAQRDVYASMLWLARNTPDDSVVVSITDSRYSYTGLVATRSAGYSPLATPDDVLQQLSSCRSCPPSVQHLKGVYVALTRIATVPQSSENPLPAYSGDSRFQLVYSNPDVRIFLVKANSSA